MPTSVPESAAPGQVLAPAPVLIWAEPSYHYDTFQPDEVGPGHVRAIVGGEPTWVAPERPVHVYDPLVTFLIVVAACFAGIASWALFETVTLRRLLTKQSARVNQLEGRVDGLESRPTVHLPTPAAEARVRELVATGLDEHAARNRAQVEALDLNEPSVGDEPITDSVADTNHSRIVDMQAFGHRKA